MTTADEWYDEWFARVNRRYRSPHVRKALEIERAGIAYDVEATGLRAYDATTDLLREQLHGALALHL